MSEGQPLVSVCIPLYNAGAFIGATVDSVLRQTYPNWELIIADDMSTDGGWEIVLAYRDPRIRCFRNPQRLGAEGNWNGVISAAKGEYVKLLCHDDLLAPECLERQVAAFQADRSRGLALVCCARDIIDKDGRKTLRRRWVRKDARMEGKQAVRETLRAGTNLIGEPSAVLFRLDDVSRVGLFDGGRQYGIDLDYWVRLLALGDCYYLAASLCSFRMSRQSWSSQLARHQNRQFREILLSTWRSGSYGVTVLDVISGFIMCQIKGLLRRLWFHFHA